MPDLNAQSTYSNLRNLVRLPAVVLCVRIFVDMENCNAGNTIYLKYRGPSPPLPSHHKQECRREGFNHAAFRLLDWPVFAPITSIRVLDLDEDTQQPQWTALFRDGEPHHPVAQEPVHSPPVSRMHIVINASSAPGSRHGDGLPGRLPAPLVIANHDGTPITVAQFVREFGSYALRHRDRFAGVCGPWSTTPDQIYYMSCLDLTDAFAAVCEVFLAPCEDSARCRHWANVAHQLQAESRWRQDEAAVQQLGQLMHRVL
ncbi:hypothetical protein DL769_002415 [Monosporascus sp. CRB-8-3]|nr:hypothetical protein DL769_002415 [Monosporascus sp. CRB-8-3]